MTSIPAHPTQRAIVQTGYGDPSAVLVSIANLPIVAPTAHAVQVQVRASSINPIDWQMIKGNRRLIHRRRFPFIPLFDVAGIVTAVGSEVSAFAVGDRVYGDNEVDAGGGGEYVTMSDSLLSRAPAGVSFVEAAAIPLAAQTALMCIDRGGISTGTRVAVVGASGGVGHFAVQMASAAGALVTGVSSEKNRDFVLGLGAEDVVDRNATNLAAAYGPDSFDVVIDTVGGRVQWEQARLVLRPGGKFVTISRDEDDVMDPAAVLRLIVATTPRLIRALSPRGIKYIPVFLRSSTSLLERVTALVESGSIRPHIGQVFPLTIDGVTAAIDESRRGRTVGKLALER